MASTVLLGPLRGHVASKHHYRSFSCPGNPIELQMGGRRDPQQSDWDIAHSWEVTLEMILCPNQRIFEAES
jgi:hypothetical protein